MFRFKRRNVIVVVIILFFLKLLFASHLLQKAYVPVILMYHSVNPSASKKNMIAITDKTFARQMKFLKNHRYKVVSLENLVSLIKTKQRIPYKTIVLTFDDGYRDIYAYAFSVLKKYNFPATIFVIVNEIGRPQGDRLNWEEISKMQSSGLMVVGSHCLGPEPLVNIKDEGIIRREIFDSKRILEERLGRQVLLFSYPEGKFNDRIRALVRQAGYLAAVATKPGRRFSRDDIFALKRLRISENASNMFVFAFEASGFYTFLKELGRREKK